MMIVMTGLLLFLSSSPSWGVGFEATDSCVEVRRAFQMDDIGNSNLVPRNPIPGGQLKVCASDNTTCCTRRTERRYRTSVTQLLTRALDDVTRHLVTQLQTLHRRIIEESQMVGNRASESVRQLLIQSKRFPTPTVDRLTTQLFEWKGDLSAAEDEERKTLERVQNFFSSVFVVMLWDGDDSHRDDNSPPRESSKHNLECITRFRSDTSAFAQASSLIAAQFTKARRRLRTVLKSVKMSTDAIKLGSWLRASDECHNSLLRMRYCSHCFGITLIQPCARVCRRNMESCLGDADALEEAWSGYASALVRFVSPARFSSSSHPGGPKTETRSGVMIELEKMERSLVNISQLIVTATHQIRNGEHLRQARKQCVLGSHSRHTRSTTQGESETATRESRKSKRRRRKEKRHKSNSRKSRSGVKPPYMMLKEDSSFSKTTEANILDFSKRYITSRRTASSKQRKKNKPSADTTTFSQYINQFTEQFNTTLGIVSGVCSNASDAAFQIAFYDDKCWDGYRISKYEEQRQGEAPDKEDRARDVSRLSKAIHSLNNATRMLMAEWKGESSNHPLIKDETPLIVIEKKEIHQYTEVSTPPSIKATVTPTVNADVKMKKQLKKKLRSTSANSSAARPVLTNVATLLISLLAFFAWGTN